MTCNPFCRLVGAKGFEPSTPCTPCRCATRLRYAPTESGIIAEEDRGSRAERGESYSLSSILRMLFNSLRMLAGEMGCGTVIVPEPPNAA